jgi:hypothetical protein
MRNTFDYYDDDLYLAHHGIKGMKWGIRRYQNEDGSLTPEGIKRYGPNGANYLNANAEKRANDKGKLKKAAIVASVAAGTAALAYGGYKLNKVLVKSLKDDDIKLGNKFLANAEFAKSLRYSALNRYMQEEYARLETSSRNHAQYFIKRADDGLYSFDDKMRALKKIVKR